MIPLPKLMTPMPTRLPAAALAALAFLLTAAPSPTAAQPGPEAERATPGDYTGHTVEDATVRLEAENATARITFPEAGVVRVDWTRPGAEPDTSYGVLPRSTSPDAPRVVETDSTLFVRSPAMTVAARKHPLRLRFADETGRTLVAESDSNAVFANTTRTVRFRIDPDTRFYGTGERSEFGLHGTAFDVYNTAIFNYNRARMTMKVNVPFVSTTGGYGLFIDSHHPGRFDVGAADSTEMAYAAQGGTMTYYVLGGGIPEQIEHYTALTGRQPMPPKWSLGYIQSKYGYRNASQARGVVDTLRAKGFPVDALVLDLYWFEHMGDLAWNRDAFPRPFQMMRDLKRKGVQTVAITEPYIVEPSRLYEPAVDSGYVGTTEDGAPYPIEDWWSCSDCDAVLWDATNPDARDWWWSQYPDFMGDEMAGLWTDLGEPEKHPDAMRHHGGSARSIHNLYNNLWAQTLYRGWQEERPNQRIFNLTRSGFTGIQRNGTTLWSGDVARSWTGFQDQPALLLNVGLAGIGLYGSDLGGFSTGTTTPELYARWMQHGALTPTMRPHGFDGQQPTEPWRFGPDAEEVSRSAARLRYRLMPLLYTLAWENHRTGLPLARPLFFADPSDDRLHGVTDAYLLGESLLVAPVLQDSARTKDVVLPEGTWIPWGTDRPRQAVIDGGRTVTVDAPLDRIPLFVNAGSMVPTRPVAPHTGAQPADTLGMRVVPDPEADASFSVYEDDGQTLAYRDGAYSITSLRQTWEASEDDRTLVLSIGAASGTYDGQPEARTLQPAIHRLAASPTRVTANGQALSEQPTVEAVRKEGGWSYEADAGVLHVQIRGRTHAAHTITVEGVSLR